MKPLVIWRLLDGKPGHENQTLGLANALARLRPVLVHEVPVRRGWRNGLNLLLGRCPQTRHLPSPDLLLGAGHATHVMLLACRRARGGRSVVLMRPSLPRRWFDLCVIPEHDGATRTGNVLPTRGVLNAVRRAEDKDLSLGLILIGGPSAHFDWDPTGLCEQVCAITRNDPRRWLIASSRRTPEATVQALSDACGGVARVVPADQVPRGWLAQQMGDASIAWVTADSVSMLYEALTAGAACGVLAVPHRGESRVAAGVARLMNDNVVCSYQDWQRGQKPVPPVEAFDEAGRCAQWIVDKWFAN